MPRDNRSPDGTIAPQKAAESLRSLPNLWSTVREFDVRQLRDELERPLRIYVFGRPDADWSAVLAILDREGAIAIARTTPLDARTHDEISRADLVILAATLEGGVSPEDRMPLETAQAAGVPTALVLVAEGAQNEPVDGVGLNVHTDSLVEISAEWPSEAERRLDDLLVQLIAPRNIGLGRHVPRLREVVVERLIRDAAMANAQFALISSLPSWIPLVGGIVGGAADLIVLTKNQALLVLKLAGIYGRDLNEWRQLLPEIAPVVGGAFIWRTLARSLVGLLPTPLSVLPKTAIAYVGTATVGEVARRYYRDGVQVDRPALREIQRRALARFRSSKSPDRQLPPP